jgi:glycosyltransferase involved in cell wall biosynthesis
MGLKIAMVSTWNVRCGIATYSQDLVSALAQEDAEIFVVRLPRFGTKSPELMVDLANRIPYDDIDLVHIQHEYGLYQGIEPAFFTAVRMHGKPVVTTMHAVGNWETDMLVSSVSNKVVVHNQYCQKRFPFPNTIIIPHGVTPSEPTERELAKSLMKIDKRVKIVGYLGYISAYKGLETLIQAMVKVPDAGLMICGGWFTDAEPEYITRLQDWSNRLLGKRVMWTGFIPEDKLADAYGAMDILVYPSRFATESGALLHGIAYGKAIIASNLPSFKEKAGERGALMIFRDVDDLADKIKILLENDQAREVLENSAQEYAQRNRWSEIAKQHIKLYEEILKR